MPRIIAALIVSPLAPAALAWALWQLVPDRSSLSISWLGVLILSPIVTVPITLVLGVPTYLWFQRRGWLSWWQVSLGAACVGFIVGVAFAVASILGTPNLYYATASRFYVHSNAILETVPYALFSGAFGAMVGLIFWLVASRGGGLTWRSTGRAGTRRQLGKLRWRRAG